MDPAKVHLDHLVGAFQTRTILLSVHSGYRSQFVSLESLGLPFQSLIACDIKCRASFLDRHTFLRACLALRHDRSAAGHL